MPYRYSLMAMILLPFLSLTQTPKSFAEDLSLQELYKMSPNIMTVKQVCPWRSATTKGIIRLMKIEDKGAHKLYVQWLREGIAGTNEAPM